MNSASPLALICLTLLINSTEERPFTWEQIPAIIYDEVAYYYPLLTGKPIPTKEEE